MNLNRVYLDNAATTWLDPEVAKVYASDLGAPSGNASSVHRLGVKASVAIEDARETVADALGVSSSEIFFTASGTESNNLAILGFCRANKDKGRHLVVSAIEHPSVLAAARALTREGFDLTILPVNREGFVQPEALREALRPDTALVSIMHANNEVGSIQDVESLARSCREAGVAFHVDATQSFTKEPLNLGALEATIATVSAHKLHGPRGVGALFVREGTLLEPLVYGGGQEQGLRSGTYNTEGIAAFGKAVNIAMALDPNEIRRLRDHVLERLLHEIPGLHLNGPVTRRLCNNINFTIPGVDAKALLFDLDRKNISVSAGSACSAGKKAASPVLTAMGFDFAHASETIRVSLSRFTTKSELDFFVETVKDWVHAKRGG